MPFTYYNPFVNSTAKKIFLLALILRLVPVLLSVNLPIGLDDMFHYDMLGRSIAAGNGYRWYAQEDLDLIQSYVDLEPIGDYDPDGVLTSFRAPGYPAFLAIIYTLSGMQWRFLVARLVQALLGATLAPMVYALARRLFPERQGAAKFAGLALACYPMLVIYPLALATENLFIPLITAGLLLLLRAGDSSRWQDYALAGIVFGAATLTRSVIFAFVGLAVLWAWFYVKERRGALVFALAAVLMVLPWTVRNTLLHGQFTFVENSLGYNLHMGYHPEGRGSFQYGISMELMPYFDDGERNRLGIEQGLAFIRQDPGRVPALIVNKLGFFFSLERRALTYFYSNNFFGFIPFPALSALFLLFMAPWAALTILAAFGLPFLKLDRSRALLLLLIGGYLGPHLLLLAEPRFHLALVPALSILAGYAWAARRQIWTQALSDRPRLLLALALIALLCLNWGLELGRDADKLAALFGPEGNTSYFPY